MASLALRHGLAARVLLAQVLLELTLEPCAFAALLLRRLHPQMGMAMAMVLEKPMVLEKTI